MFPGLHMYDVAASFGTRDDVSHPISDHETSRKVEIVFGLCLKEHPGLRFTAIAVCSVLWKGSAGMMGTKKPRIYGRGACLLEFGCKKVINVLHLLFGSQAACHDRLIAHYN